MDNTKSRMFLAFFALAEIFSGTVSSTFIDEFSSNTSALLGNDIILVCKIIMQTEGSSVIWKKISEIDTQTEVLTVNNRTINPLKYGVQDEYNLIIKGVGFSDEGLYECDSGVERLQLSLTTLVPMSNMSITWGIPTPFHSNSVANLTCRSVNSRPPATLRWFQGSHEITHLAANTRQVTRINGYGDASSTISTTVTSRDVPYVCVADLPGYKAVRTEFVFPPLISATSPSSELSSLFCLASITVALLVI